MRGTLPVYNFLARNVGLLSAQRGSLMILMYHRVQDTPSGIQYVSTKCFGQHMDYLASSGYRTLTMRQVREDWPDVVSGPKAVALTFDDIWASQVDECLPALSQRGFVGTFFASTAWIRERRYRPTEGPFGIFESDLGSWKDIETLRDHGMEIGAHTHTHSMMSQLGRSQVEGELATSNSILRDVLNVPVTAFAFPFGKRRTYARWMVQILPQFGYNIACTTRWGRPTAGGDLLQLPRIDVNGADTIERFRMKLAGRYDFLRWIQR